MVGAFDKLGTVNRDGAAAVQVVLGNIMPWDPDPGSGVYAIDIKDTLVYFGGGFSSLGGVGRSRLGAVHKVSGVTNSWNPNVVGSVYGLDVSDSVAYAGGNFNTVDGTIRRRFAALYVDSTSNYASDWNTDFGSTGGQINKTIEYGEYVFLGGAVRLQEYGPLSNFFLPYRNELPPIVQGLSDQFECAGSSGSSISFTIQDETVATLNVIVTSSNNSVVHNDSIQLSGAGNAWFLNYSTASGIYDSTTISVTATDQNGNTSTSEFVIFTVDTIAPIITAPSNIDTIISSGACFAIISALGTPVYNDNCEMDTVFNNAPDSFAIGQTHVTWFAADALGNIDSATQVVNVRDGVAPSITAPGNVTAYTGGAQCWASGIALGSASATDNCSSVAISNNSPDTLYVGETTVLWFAEDAAGNVDTAYQTVTVLETIAPILLIPPDTFGHTGLSTCSSPLFDIGGAIAIDNCSDSVSISNNAASIFSLGTNSVIWTATDSSENMSSDTQLVFIFDTIPPTIQAPTDLVTNIDLGSCFASGIALGSPNASDNCSVDSITNDAPANFPIGITLVHWTVHAGGLTATDSQSVTVLDNVFPTITAPANVSIAAAPGTCSNSGVYLGVPATNDNCSLASITNNAPGVFPVGSTPVTWTATDLSGNSATANQTVTVYEAIPPIITAPADISVQTNPNTCFATGVSLSTPFVSDNCSSSPIITNDAPSSFPLGITVVHWTATDGSGNIAVDSQMVTVIDSIAPQAIAPGNINLVLSASQCAATGLNLGSPTAFDNCSGTSITNNAPPIFTIGTTVVTWTIADAAGNTITVNQTVNITENTPPTISAPANVTASADLGQCSATGVILGSPIAADNCSTPVVTNDAPSVFPIGNTTVTWTATDGAGNTATATQTVTITDNEPPLISAPDTIFGYTDATSCSTSSISLGTAAGSDNCGTITFSNNALGSYSLGVNEVVWTATDAAGNTANDTQMVVILDNVSPVPDNNSLPNVMGECSVVITTTPTATDNCSGALTGTTNDPLSYPQQGTYSITWQFDDGNGNVVYQQQHVVVSDTSAPIVSGCHAPISVCSLDTVFFGAPSGSDNCTGVSVSQIAGGSSGTVFPLGVDTVVFLIADSNGNQATCSFEVQVNSLPIIDLAVTNATCYGFDDGTATISATNGLAPYSINWNGADSSQLLSGNYSVEVSDANGCSSFEAFIIDQPDLLMGLISVVEDSAGTCNGTATANISGGTVPYNYLWNDSVAQTQMMATGLCAGLYCVTVTDSNGCTFDTCDITIALGQGKIISDDNLSIFPNPSRGVFNLTLKRSLNLNTRITVYDFSGKVVIDREFDKAQTEIDLRSFSSGLYTLVISGLDKPLVSKLILQQ